MQKSRMIWMKKLIATMAVGNCNLGNGARETLVEDEEQVLGGERVFLVRDDGYQLPTKNYQVEFSKFDGTRLKDRIYKSEQLFDVDNTLATSRVKLALYRLEGKALKWHQTLMKNRVTREWPSWGGYMRCLHFRFSTELFDNPLRTSKT